MAWKTPTPEQRRRTAKIAKLIRILLYLGIAFMLFSQAKADGQFDGRFDGRFKVQKIKIGSQTLDVEIADDNAKRSLGLMNRKVLKDGKGMLFIFEEQQILSFWMKNTLIPLSIGYFDQNKKLFQTLDMKPASPMDAHPPSYPSSRPGKYALEVPIGWYNRHKITPGATFTFVEMDLPKQPRR